MKDPGSTFRVVLAFLLCPIAPCLIATLQVDGARWFLFFAPFVYLLTWAISVPAYLLFRGLNWLKFWQVLLGGVVLSSGLPLASLLIGGGPTLQNTLLLALYGAAASSVFWVIAFGGRRSNNSFKPNPLRSFKTPSDFSGGSA
jgi:hypothetical protein